MAQKPGENRETFGGRLGCGEGNALNDAYKKAPHVRYVGFSNKKYTAWNSKPHIEFIWESGNDFFRYFKQGTISIMFTHMGLGHHQPAPDYMLRLCKTLRPGGRLVSDTDFTQELVKGILNEQLANKTIEQRQANTIAECAPPYIRTGRIFILGGFSLQSNKKRGALGCIITRLKEPKSD